MNAAIDKTKKLLYNVDRKQKNSKGVLYYGREE